MSYGRWLLCVTDEAQSLLLDSTYEKWSLALLGSQPWRSSAVAAGELGWVLSGSAQGVLDVAKRRASLWSLAQTYTNCVRRSTLAARALLGQIQFETTFCVGY